MPNKLIATAIAAAALALCGQAFAQNAVPDKTGRVPNINPNLPADTGGAHVKHHKSHAKKSKPSKKSAESESHGASPSTGADSTPPSQ